MIDANLFKDETPFNTEDLDSIGLVHMDESVFNPSKKGKICCVIDLTSEQPRVFPYCSAIPPKLIRLVEAAPHMFQAFGAMLAKMQRITDALEEVNAEFKRIYGQEAESISYKIFTAALVDLENAALLARRVAVEGSLKVSAELHAGSVDKSNR